MHTCTHMRTRANTHTHTHTQSHLPAYPSLSLVSWSQKGWSTGQWQWVAFYCTICRCSYLNLASGWRTASAGESHPLPSLNLWNIDHCFFPYPLGVERHFN